MTDEFEVKKDVKPSPLPSIGREPTPSEELDWTGGVVGAQNAEMQLRRYLSNIEQEFTKDHKPFDYPCALADCKRLIKTMDEERQMSRLSASKQAQKFKVSLGDIREKYGNPKRFTLLQADEVYKKQAITVEGGGGRTETIKVLDAILEKYQCNERGCRIQVEVPIDVWKERHPEEAKKLRR